MEQRTYLTPTRLHHLLDTGDQGNTVAQTSEGDEGIIVQVEPRSGILER
jgi:hypothetical protein